MNGYFIFAMALAMFQIGWAATLTGRVFSYTFAGSGPLFTLIVGIGCFMFFYVTGTLLLLIALPFRLFGIKMYPVFVPDEMRTGEF